MNDSRIFPLALLSSLVLAGVACSGDDASDGAAAAKETMSQPASADLTAKNGTSAYTTSQKQQQTGGFSPFGGGSGSSDFGAARFKSIGRTFANVESGCADLDASKEEGTCPCPGGGSLEYAISDVDALKSGNLEGEISMSFVFDACTMEDGAMSGKMVMIQSKNPIVDKSTWAPGAGESKAPATGSPGQVPGLGGGLNFLWQAEGLSNGKETLDFALLFQEGEMCLRPPVDQGFYYLCISGAAVNIYAKNGTYSCDFQKGTCTGDEGVAIALEGSIGGGGGGGGSETDGGGGGGGGMTCGAKQCGESQFCCFDEADTCVSDLSACPR